MRSKHRRRYHTARVIKNRRARGIAIEAGVGWMVENPPPSGKLDDVFYYRGCGRARCHLCHWDKLDLSRRARERRAWKREVVDQLA